jgi:hypothetical protein
VASLIGRGVPLRRFAHGLITTGPVVQELAAADTLFYGFDVVWFFRTVPDEGPVGREPRPSLDEALADSRRGPRPTGPALDTLVRWMEATGAQLGLADGCGLVYATTDAGVAAAVSAAGLG